MLGQEKERGLLLPSVPGVGRGGLQGKGSRWRATGPPHSWVWYLGGAGLYDTLPGVLAG